MPNTTDPRPAKFDVTLTRIVNYEVCIEAETKEAAMEIADELSLSELEAYHVCGGELTVDYADPV